MKRLTLIAAAVWAAIVIAGGFCAVKRAPRYRHEFRQDLSIYFTNAESVIQKLRNALKDRQEKIIITYTSHSDNMQDIAPLVSQLMAFALEETDDPAEGDYIYYQYGGYDLSYTLTQRGGAYEYELTLTPDYYTDARQEREFEKRLNTALDSLNVYGAGEYEKVKAVHDFICQSVQYDKVHQKNEHYHLKSTAYGALVNGRALCQGYSVLMYRMLRELGVECRVITGTVINPSGEEEYHARDLVKVNGEYRCIDVMWDCQQNSYDYFLMPDDGLLSVRKDNVK